MNPSTNEWIQTGSEALDAVTRLVDRPTQPGSSPAGKLNTGLPPPWRQMLRSTVFSVKSMAGSG